MVVQSFYNAMHGLADKGLIRFMCASEDEAEQEAGMDAQANIEAQASLESENNTKAQASAVPRLSAIKTSPGYRGYHCIQIIVPSAPILLELKLDANKKSDKGKEDKESKEVIIIEDAAKQGQIAVAALEEYISQSGRYLNLRECSLVYSNAFRKLRPEAKKLMLHMLFRRQTSLAMLGRVRNGKVIVPPDLAISVEQAASLLNLDWQRGLGGQMATP